MTPMFRGILSTIYIDLENGITQSKVIKKLSRKKDAPEELKKHIEKLKTLETEFKEADKTRIVFLKKQEVKDFKKTIAQNNRLSWKKRKEAHKQKVKIVSLYPQLQIL